MNSKYQFDNFPGAGSQARIVYVRPIDRAELPDHVRAQAAGHKDLYGVFGANGEQIALTPNRATALMLARENALTPLSVH